MVVLERQQRAGRGGGGFRAMHARYTGADYIGIPRYIVNRYIVER